MHPPAFKIHNKISGLYPFAEVGDSLPIQPHQAFICVHIVPILRNGHSVPAQA